MYFTFQECVIKNTHKKPNRKITDFADSGFINSRSVEETKEDWEYSVWSGASAQPAPPQPVKRKRGPTKKDKSESKQAKLDQLTLVS